MDNDVPEHLNARTQRVLPRPKQLRSRQTYERCLDAAGELLAEVGVQAINTNLICARAGITPPALYRFFRDKYDVLAALAERLMERQGAVLEQWLGQHAAGGIQSLSAHVAELVRANARVMREQPGAIWIMRSLRAVPQLTPLRQSSNAAATKVLVEAYAPYFAHISRERLALRVRISVEFAYTMDEALLECPPDEAEQMLQEASRMLASLFVIDPPLTGS